VLDYHHCVTPSSSLPANGGAGCPLAQPPAQSSVPGSPSRRTHKAEQSSLVPAAHLHAHYCWEKKEVEGLWVHKS